MAPYLQGEHFESQATEAYGDWRDEFFDKGYVVLKGVVPQDRALHYRNKMIDWLGTFDNDFDINNRDTWSKENLPQSFKSGMYLNYCAAHEKYVWEARQYVYSQSCCTVMWLLIASQRAWRARGILQTLGH